MPSRSTPPPASCCGCTASTRANGAAARPPLSGRGVAYWTDGRGDERIYFVTLGYQLIALDAKTGDPVRAFGQNGVVNLKQNNDQVLDLDHGRNRAELGAGRRPRRRHCRRRAPRRRRAAEQGPTQRGTFEAST